jgi:hypothetical protein
MTKTIHGKVHGKLIELDHELDVAEGQDVEVTVRVLPPKTEWGNGIRRSAGAMAPYWTEQDDQILEQLARERKRPSRRETPG